MSPYFLPAITICMRLTLAIDASFEELIVEFWPGYATWIAEISESYDL